MNFSHDNCPHPKTSKARAACRKAMKRGLPTGDAGLTLPTLRGPLDDLPPVLPVEVSPMISTGEHMGRADAVRITEDLFAQHGLTGWHVVFDNARRRAGACNYTRRQIRLSSPLMQQRSWADTHETITHEIAHALTPGHNHDLVWAAKHRELGGKGARCFDHVDEDAPWIGTCGHGKRFTKYRRPKRLEGWRCRCVRGGSPIVWEEQG